MNNAFSYSDKNPSPIFIAANLSAVNLDPLGTFSPSFPSSPVAN